MNPQADAPVRQPEKIVAHLVSTYDRRLLALPPCYSHWSPEGLGQEESDMRSGRTQLESTIQVKCTRDALFRNGSLRGHCNSARRGGRARLEAELGQEQDDT